MMLVFLSHYVPDEASRHGKDKERIVHVGSMHTIAIMNHRKMCQSFLLQPTEV